jgi:hypothetical protein
MMAYTTPIQIMPSESDERPVVKTAPEIRRQLADLWLSASGEQYKELAETWKALETKAQGAITVAGIFLAATFAFAREAASLDTISKLLVGVTAILLVASVTVALLSLEIRQVLAPPMADFVEGGTRDLMKLQDAQLTEDLVARFVVDRANEWKQVNGTLAKENHKKAKQVWISQLLLGAATVPVAVVTVMVLL